MRALFNKKGQSIIEITLMTPLILVALYVPFDFGMTMFTGHLTQTAVRDAARIAATTDEIDNTKATNLATQVYNNDLPQLLTSKSVTVNYYADGATDCAQIVEVTAQGTYDFFLYKLMALVGFTAPDGVSITRTTRMRYEFQADFNGGTGSTTTYCDTGSATATGTYPPSA